MNEKFDFSGWATRNNIKCSDGRVIKHGAFKDNDGQTVPLVWNHRHDGPSNVLGHALLENRDEGVYAYCSFNETEKAKEAKELVAHGDVSALSIYANKLKQVGSDVIHGAIREVSLVLAGANPGAFIDNVLCHGEEVEGEAVIYTGESLELEHSGCGNSCASDEEKKKKELEHAKCVEDPEKKKDLEHSKCGEDPEKKKDLEHAKEEPSKEDQKMAEEKKVATPNESEETVQDVFNTLTEKQKKVVYALIGAAVEDAKNKKKSDKEDSEMKHNVFENETNNEVLEHGEELEIINDAKRYGSMKESVLQHGIENVDYLFPDAKSLNNPPEWISREMAWTSKVLGGVHRTPFSRIKSMFANITEDDARARGYIKGNFKKEEVFPVLKRTTTPTTIYKKQKMDRDDVVDITSFDVIAWLKSEMRVLLDEELARAILIGDGRDASSDDKINELNIRPIWTDDQLYTIRKVINHSASATEDQKYKDIIRGMLQARIDYKGSGNPTFFTTEEVLTGMLLIEDGIGHRLYKSEEELRTALRVKEIVTVEVMENKARVESGNTYNLVGILVNLADYNVGADKGGAVNMFDDFDIDYNQQKYLIETRCSGALVKPYSAIAIEETTALYLDVEPESASTTVLGKSVSDLQSGVHVHDTYVQGVSKYVTGYTGYSGDPAEQSGNYIAIKVDAPAGATVTGQMGSRTVTFDSDMNMVVRLTNKRTQVLKLTATLNGASVTRTLKFSDVELKQA